MSFILTDITDRVATITLNDPRRRNAFNLELADELVATVEAIEKQDVGAMVITGAGRAFCAGADLGILERAEGTELVRVYRSFTRVFQSDIPSVAAVNGPAVGAGLNLALCCDLRLAGESAVFDAAFLKLGVHPGGGSTWLLTRQLGLQGALALTVFEQSLTGPEAAEKGVAWRCLPDGELLATAQDFARRAAHHPPALMRKLNHTVNHMEQVGDHGTAVQYEMDEQLWSLRQPEARRAIAARRQQISGA